MKIAVLVLSSLGKQVITRRYWTPCLNSFCICTFQGEEESVFIHVKKLLAPIILSHETIIYMYISKVTKRVDCNSPGHVFPQIHLFLLLYFAQYLRRADPCRLYFSAFHISWIPDWFGPWKTPAEYWNHTEGITLYLQFLSGIFKEGHTAALSLALIL